MRTTHRPRRYVSKSWLLLLRPCLRFSAARDAYVLRAVGSRVGPVLRADRRREPGSRAFEGVERRRTRMA
jgi:hypothetical protein